LGYLDLDGELYVLKFVELDPNLFGELGFLIEDDEGDKALHGDLQGDLHGE
jgi:hypothetical protein